MTRLSVKLILFFILWGTISAKAQVPPVLRQSQNRIQLEQQQLLNEEFRRQELKNALKRPARSEKSGQSAALQPVSAQCVRVHKIDVSGNSQMKLRSILKITRKYENACLSLSQINQLLNEITDLYIRRGYITSRAFMKMPQVKLPDGILEIRLIEGKISKIEGLSAGEILTAFSLLPGKILNLRDIEQGIDQINRLSSNLATMEIKPDERNGFSKIMIQNRPKGRSRFSIFSDNAGSEATGEARFGFRAAQDNLLGINDQINLSYAKAPSKDDDHRDADYFTLGLSVPFGYWSLNNNFSWSDYRTSFLLFNGDRFYSYGNSVTNSLSLDRLLARGQNYKISAGGGLIYKRNQNYSKVLDLKSKNEVSSRDLAIVNLGLNATFYFGSGVLYLNPAYQKGTKWFGALNDNHNNFSQKAQYEAWKLYAYYSRELWGKATYTATFDGQFSPDELYGTEAFYLGGEYSVRGFRNEGVQGDSGYALRNDLEFSLGKLAGSDKDLIRAVRFGPFIDYGYVHNNNPLLKSEILSGAGGKVSVQYKYLDASVGYATVLKKPKWIDENEAVYLFAGLNFRFN